MTRRPAKRGGATVPRVLFLNGPNANLYGLFAQDVYGGDTFDRLRERCVAAGRDCGLAVDFRQSNHEGELIDWIQQAIGERVAGIVINGAGLSYTSIAILDALLAFPGPIVECHMSNIHRREPFRHRSYISQAATGIVAGLGADGYELAVLAMRRLVDRAAVARGARRAR